MTARPATHAAAIALLAIAGLTATSTAASAAPTFKTFTGNGTTSTCNGLTLCVYADNSFKGEALGVQGGDLNESSLRNSQFDDRVSSIVNNSSSVYCFWTGDGRKGLSFQLHGGETSAALPVWINNGISSWAVGQCRVTRGTR